MIVVFLVRLKHWETKLILRIGAEVTFAFAQR